MPIKVSGREKGFHVANVLAREVSGDCLGDEGKVLILAEKLVLPYPGLDKVREVPVFESLRKSLQIWNGWISSILEHEFPQRVVWNSTLKVQVKLDLGDSLEPARV